MLLSYILWDIREELCLRGGECNDEEKQGSCIYNLIAERVFVRCSQRWLEMAPSLSTLTVHRTMAEQPTASSEMCWRRRMTALCSLRVWSLVATQAEKQREFMRAKGAYKAPLRLARLLPVLLLISNSILPLKEKKSRQPPQINMRKADE